MKDKDKETVSNKTVPDSFVRDGAPESPSIDEAIKRFFGGSKYLIDYERNIIVATGTRAQLRAIEDIIQEFDRPSSRCSSRCTSSPSASPPSSRSA